MSIGKGGGARRGIVYIDSLQKVVFTDRGYTPKTAIFIVHKINQFLHLSLGP